MKHFPHIGCQTVIGIEEGKTDMNNHSDMQSSSTQGQTISNIPKNQEHAGIIKKTPTNGYIGKTDETLTLGHNIAESAETG